MAETKNSLNHDLKDLPDGHDLKKTDKISTPNIQRADKWVFPSDWQVKMLGTLGSFSKGKGISTIDLIESGIPCVRYGELYTKHDYVIKNYLSFISESTASQSIAITKGDILFEGSGETIEEIGKSAAIIKDDTVYAGGDIIILTTNLLTDSICLSYALESDFVRKQKRRLGQGNSVVHIYARELSKIEIALPPLPEQRAIAKVLGKMDEAINANNQLIAQKELRKKWLMQNVLTGKQRLKGFSGEWEEVPLKDDFQRVTRKNGEKNTNVVTISAQRGFVRQQDFFKKNIASELLDNYFLVEKGEFCYNKSYSNGYPKGATKRLNDFDKSVVTTLYICFGIKNKTKTSVDFFEQFFEANYLDRGLTKIAHEGGRAHGLLNVTPSDFFSLIIATPSFEEQTAIAQILQAADKELNLLKAKTDKLKDQKKGMMQVLLTGKKRLKLSEQDLKD